MPGWPGVLARLVAAQRAEPFVWGRSDCSFAFDAVVALTGWDPIADVRGYRSEAGVLKRLRRAGFASTRELVEARFRFISPAAAGRGDLGYQTGAVDALQSPCLIVGAYAVSKGPDGFAVVPLTDLVSAYEV